MDELSRAIQDEIPWCMLFADDIVLLDETRANVNAKLELVEYRGFRLSRTKIEYIECKFSKQRYLDSIIRKDWEINSDVDHRIQVGWLKWRSAIGVLCNCNIPL